MAAHDRRTAGVAAGFTLLELIVALAVLALIAGSVAAGIRLAAASIERGETVARDAARLRAAVGIVERAIRSADPLPVPVEDNTTFYFAGEETMVRLITAQPPATIRGRGPRLISFHEIQGPEGGLAVSTASPFRREGAAGWRGTEEPRILVRGASELTFTYSEGPSAEGVWEWLRAWDPKETGRLPAAVRVEFTTVGEAGPQKTAFVVTVPAGGALGE